MTSVLGVMVPSARAANAVANLNVSRVSAESYRRMRVFSSRSYVSMDFLTNNVKIYSRNKNQSFKKKSVDAVRIDALKEQDCHFLECITNHIPPLVSGMDGVRTLHYTQVIQKKIHERAFMKSLEPARKIFHGDNVILEGRLD